MANYEFIVYIGDDALREIVLAALEAYDVPEPARKKKLVEHRHLETFGLLWGHERSIPGSAKHYFVESASVELHAKRHSDWVVPNPRSFQIKRQCMDVLFPMTGWLGTFHSHPYKNLKEVSEAARGYYFSDTDLNGSVECAPEWWPLGYRVDLVTTICKLEKMRGSDAERLRNNVVKFDIGEFRFWINACVIYKVSGKDPKKNGFEVTGNNHSRVWLEVPYLTGGLYPGDRISGSHT